MIGMSYYAEEREGKLGIIAFLNFLHRKNIPLEGGDLKTTSMECQGCSTTQLYNLLRYQQFKGLSDWINIGWKV